MPDANAWKRRLPKGMLSGKLVHVTGAGLGIGRAYAHGIAYAGCRVIVSDIDGDSARRTASEVAADGGECHPFVLDVADFETAKELARRIGHDFGPIDILVNNAGMSRKTDFDDPAFNDAFAEIFRVNVNGLLNLTRAHLPQLKQTRGCVLNTASITGINAHLGGVVYGSSKAAVAQATKFLARDLAPHGIRVNAVAPGIIATRMTDAARADPERAKRTAARTMLDRYGDPEELVGPMLFLCSPMASYVTGVTLPVDGGFAAM